MSYYYKLGRIPHKRHTQFRKPDGSLYHEELMGIHGFVGNKSLLYHLRPPTDVRQIERGCEVKIPYAAPGPVQHRLLLTANLPANGDAVTGRLPLMANGDVCLSVARPQQTMSYWYRYAHGDEVIFIHEGTGILESQFGTLRYGPGDYLVIPTGVIWRIVLRRRCRSSDARWSKPRVGTSSPHGGMSITTASFSKARRIPARHPAAGRARDTKRKASSRSASKRVTTSPAMSIRITPDVIGWDGHLWPFAFNIEDFEPITGRVHQPPPVHQTFDGPGFVLARSCLGCSTITRSRFRPLITTRTWTPTK